MNHQTSLPQMPLLKRPLVFLWTWTLIVTRVSALSGVSRIIPNVNVSNSGYRRKGNYNHSLGDPHFRPFGRDPTPLQFVPNLVSSSRSTDTQRTSNRPLWLQCPIRPPGSISVGSLPVVGETTGDDSHDDAPIEERHEEDGEREDDDGDQEDAWIRIMTMQLLVSVRSPITLLSP